MVGNFKNEKIFMGVLISKEYLVKVKGYVDIVEKEGVIIVCGKEELNLEDFIKNVDCYILCYFLNYKKREKFLINVYLIFKIEVFNFLR